MSITLQQELISSLTPLISKVNNPQRLKEIHAVLKRVKIPNDHYSQVTVLLLHILYQMPEILEASPQNKKFEALCKNCANHVATLEELRTKKTFGKRK